MSNGGTSKETLPSEILGELSRLCDDSRLVEYLTQRRRREGVVDLVMGELYREVLEGVTALDSAVAAAYGIEPRQVISNYGSNGSIDTILVASMASSRTKQPSVQIANPTYYYFHKAALARRFDVRTVDLCRFQLDTDAFIARMREAAPSAIYLASPNNPTGCPVPDDELVAILDAMPEGTWGIVDRSLANIQPEISTGDLLKRFADRPLVVLHSFSKYRRMAHLRVGVALCSNGAMADRLAPFRPLGNTVAGCFRAAEAVVSAGGIVPLPEVLGNIAANAETAQRIAREGPNFQISPFTGNYALVQLSKGPETSILCRDLLQSHVAVVGGHEFPMPIPNAIRIQTAGDPADFRRGLEILAQVVEAG